MRPAADFDLSGNVNTVNRNPETCAILLAQTACRSPRCSTVDLKPRVARVNHKRIYRIMRLRHLLLPRYSGRRERTHDGVVVTLKSNLR
jgi:hypothetical protein